MTSEAELLRQLRELGVVPGSIVVVHTAFRAVGPVEGGPLALIASIRAALGPEGTLVMPAISDDDTEPFDPGATPCRGMGVVADTFWRVDGVARSDNPASFAAAGPDADAIVAPHPLSPPHGIDSPVGRACALGGWVLLLGVGHEANTTLHLAESLAGVPYRVRKQCVIVRDGARAQVEYEETDHCCSGFARADEWLRARHQQREGSVGRAMARLVRAHDLVRLAVAELRRDPFVFLHAADAGCDECARAWQSVQCGSGLDRRQI